MIKIPEGQVIPRFYLPVKYSINERTVECHLFFLAPFAILYEKIINQFYYFWHNLIIDDQDLDNCIINMLESHGTINKETHKLEIDLFELDMLKKRIRNLLKGKNVSR